MTSVPFDIFAKDKRSNTPASIQSYFNYYGTKKAWILWSAGPDFDYDLDHAFLKDTVKFGESEDVFQMYDFFYDPTNGTLSNGDIYQLGGEGTGKLIPEY